MKEPLVSVEMITYNHAPYIREAIDGVLRQVTNFPFELVIGEDYSTDGTREIVFDFRKKYPDIIRVITSDANVGARKNIDRVRESCRARYTACCEGDDYWTDPYKLQKQVDFLEANPDYGLVHTNYQMYSESSKRFLGKKYLSNHLIPSGMIFYDLLKKNYIGTLTVLLNRELFESSLSEYKGAIHSFKIGDYFHWLAVAKKSKVHYLPDVTAVYRLLDESASQSKYPQKNVDFVKEVTKISQFFADHSDMSAEQKNDVQRSIQRRLLSAHMRNGIRCKIGDGFHTDSRHVTFSDHLMFTICKTKPLVKVAGLLLKNAEKCKRTIWPYIAK
jgi:glycosyltransferase involved in cell wall biosynthesis